MTEDEYRYPGEELTDFAVARNWKRYVREALMPHIRGDVAEVGAGIGGTTEHLHSSQVLSWLCLEPDAVLSGSLQARIDALDLSPRPAVVVARLADLPRDRQFDTILYIDVLEHLDSDRAELSEAAARLRPCGRIVVLSPAYPWLYTAFDRAVGHLRRYTRATLERLRPASTRVVASFHLDVVGVLFNLGNHLARREQPTRRAILLWDRVAVPVSRVIDALIGRRAGRSVIVVFEKDGACPLGASA
jgi:SAM-dependent methyltransferase